ncbi:MAG: hypothetical protein JO054_06705 [Actinobacteria bacterium]|nr:hypothetical protein [Actinomycetota bacterium]
MSRNRWRLLAALALAASTALVPLAAMGADSGPAPQPAKVSRSAYFTASATTSLPAVLVHEFPPGVVCIVVPQACPEGLQQIKTALGINPGIPIPTTPDYQAPQPVLPNTLPVGLFGGKTRYVSDLKFDMPAIAAGQQVDRFDLVLEQAPLSFSMESPAFRAAVLTALSTYEEQSPDPLQSFLMSLADQSTPLLTQNVTGIEACLITKPWNEGTSQDIATAPKTDCLYGTTGKYDASANTWTFDLSSVAQAWLDGVYPNEGIELHPVGAPNVAYGDPDPSTNSLISLTSAGAATGATPQLRVATSAKPSDESSAPEPAIADTGSSSGDTTGGVLGSSVSAPSSDLLASSPSTGPVTSTITTSTGTKAKAKLASAHRKSLWYVWLWLPIALVATLALLQGFETGPDTVVAREEGALTRLVALNRRNPSP